MPLGAVVNLGTNFNIGVVTITVSPSRNVEVGEFLAVTMSERDWGITSLADNSAQAGTANSYTANVVRITDDPFMYVYSCKVTRKILSTDTITATFVGGIGGKSICVMALPDANPSSQFDRSTSSSSGGSSTYSSGTTGATAQADEYAVGAAAFAQSTVGPGTITADSPWVLQYGPGTTGYAAAHGSRVLTTIGTVVFTGGWGATHDGVQSGIIATYKATVPASATVFQARPVAIRTAA